MNKFLQLTKVFFLNSFGVNKKKNSQKSVFQTILVFGLIFLAFSAFYSYSMYMAVASEEGFGTFLDVLMLMICSASLLTLILSITQMQGSVFNTKDFETLESLPISKFTVVGAKITSIFLVTTLEDLLLTLPAVVLYYVFANDLFITLVAFIGCLFVSLIPLLISTILGAIVAVITKSLKNKTIVEVAFYLFIFIISFVISFSLNNSTVISADELVNVLVHLKLLILAFNGELIYLFIFILINLISFGLVILLISKLYRKVNLMHSKDKDSTTYVKTNKKEKTSYQKTLIKKEEKSILGNATWLINAFVGPVMYLIIGIMCLVVDFAEGAPAEDAYEVGKVMGHVVAFMALLMNMTMTSTSASFSLEGPNFESLLSYPIDEKEIIKSKIIVSLKFNFILNIIAGPIVAILTTIKFGFDLICCLELIVLPHLGYLYISLVGTLCGLRWPKLEYDNQMQVIKQGSAVGLTMLFGFLPGMILSGILFAGQLLPMYVEGLSFLPLLTLLLVATLLIIGSIICQSIIKRKGKELFRKVITR